MFKRWRLPLPGHLLRQALGQVRQESIYGPWLLLELREGGRNSPEFLRSLERELVESGHCLHAWYIPELDRLAVKRANAGEESRKAALETVEKLERSYGLHRNLFATDTRFPEEMTIRYRALLELGLDLSAMGAGMTFGKVSGRTFRFFTDLSAVSILLEQTSPLRKPLDHMLGSENTELLLRFMNAVGESFSHGWSGSLVDMALRLQQWRAEEARQQSWDQLRDACLQQIEQLRRGAEPAPQRPRPLPDGPIEKYKDTAEKLALAAFSAGMAFTHDLTQSASTFFSSLPRPAHRGRKAFCLALAQRMAKADILLLEEPSVLERLDRIDRVALDEELFRTQRPAVTATRHSGRHRTPVAVLDGLLTEPAVEWKGRTYQWRTPEQEQEVPPRLREWWRATSQPLDSLRIVTRDNRICAAVLVQEVTDHTLESVLSRMRALELKVTVLNPDKEPVRERIREYQRRGESVMAIGGSALLPEADLAVGLLKEGEPWPFGAHILTSTPLDTIWRLLSAIAQTRTMAAQSVELAKIDAFSGLILSLEKMDRRMLKRVRLAASLASLCAMLNSYRLARNVSELPLSLRHDSTPWHAMDAEAVLERLQQREPLPVALEQSAAPQPLWRLWLEEMTTPLVPILLTGAGLAIFTGAVGDALLIGTVVGLNGLIGGLQRRKTEQQLQQLGMSAAQLYTFQRGEEYLEGPAKALRPGDVLTLTAGDVAPADARILKAEALEMDESSLTGESLPVKKHTAPSFSPNLAERSSMLFEGATVVQGTVEAVVVTERSRSEARRSHYLTEPPSNGVEKRLDQLTDMTLPIAAFSGIALLLAGLSRRRPVKEVIGSGVSLAVAAVPEGLPIMATLAQLASASRLGEKGALARNPRAIEALGRMTVLCADKTGTLTEGSLALRLVAIDEEIVSVEDLNDLAREVLLIAMLASPHGSGDEDTAHVTDRVIGEAVLTHAPSLREAMHEWNRVKEMPFKSERGYHATLYQQDKNKRLCVKGAPEIVLERCNRWRQPDGRITVLDDENRKKLTELAYSLASRGYRILAVAERPARSLTLNRDKVSRLIFRGFLALADPVRESARDALNLLREAGVKVKMITGDHPVTAEAIARDLHMDGRDAVLTGAQIDAMDDQELAQTASQVSVFARVSPAQKARIVTALQSCGEVVGMTGDGANDAAAIRLAEVGIALGAECSVAAQQAADLLVVDGRIETIVTAVLEGRALWTAVRDAVSLMVGGNLGEIGFTLIAGLLEGRSPLNARQLLLINLLTDSVPALAVALRKPTKLKARQLLEEGPEASLGVALTREIQWRAGLTGGVTVVTWAVDRLLRGPDHASTVALLTLIGSQLTQTIMAGKGSRKVALASISAAAMLVAIVEIPGLARVFGCVRPGVTGWLSVIASLGASLVGAKFLPKLEQASVEAEQEIAEKVRDWLTENNVETQNVEAKAG
ncbi:Cation transport ATPase [Hahella chejuensis KCTC 2396]|uniref:Cation transport ATPase n=1 Tax=Hahella chejuensis (strain KCTC 2396) TaxID=349521 RepID=Q2SPT5_HAHCH|nr:cation-translocating P-type ATPase [Hahella chejuensis]ABC27339.1 Cation transport ATPase [Hahella chejuensis KCTC 2396]